ncbi:hypothetical protein CAPTEDRAFT_204789 [Capitella teleta]|uniref:Uncharacterized protein n=1 Tax=Capitella teleta TaxID=283909 RepID=R7UQU0_CAPTE|nr:hypothetical protein CAPTEDRAFT_204789 [Capitella teleta]|eukprot:ELU08535.1 hypothetical protein CAPTEDRAFT_204789 [Capitella teleta]
MPKLASFGWKQDKSGSNFYEFVVSLLREHGYFTIFFAIVQQHISLFITYSVRVLKFAYELVNTGTDTVHAVHWTDGFLECLPFDFLYNDSSGCLESHEGMVERRHRPSRREAATDHVEEDGS